MSEEEKRERDWNKFFMAIAVAVVFVMQAYMTSVQQMQDRHLTILENETLSEEEIDSKLESHTNTLIKKLIGIEKETLRLNREWMDWQQNKLLPKQTRPDLEETR